MSEFNIDFARSGGPGGQNVNKVNSKAILRWAVVGTTCLPGPVHMRFLDKYASRLTNEGELIIVSQRYRDQSKNVEDCFEKLKEMIESVLKPPKLRRPTKPSKASNERRVKAKSVQAKKKQSRRTPSFD